MSSSISSRQLLDGQLREIGELLDETPLDLVLEIALQLDKSFKDGLPRDLEEAAFAFPTTVITKLSQELYGFYWSLRGGSVYGAAHLLRSLMEIFAMTHHVIAKPKEVARRLAKFNEFLCFARYASYEHLRHSRDVGKIEEREFRAHNVFRQEDIQGVTDAHKAMWAKLYKSDVKGKEEHEWHKAHWHSPARIEDLLQQTPLNSSFKILYGHLCQLAHVSPLANGYIKSALIMQRHDLKKARDMIMAALACACGTIDLLSGWVFPQMGIDFRGIFSRVAQILKEERLASSME